MKKESLKIVSLTVIIFFFTQLLFAVPANPTPITFTQPDGDTLTIMIKGDERVNWSETLDGYTLLHNKAGFLVYAVLDESENLQPSEYIATDIAKRNAAIVSFLNTIEKKLFYSELQLQIMRKVWEIEDEALYNAAKNGNAVIGHYKTICAFVQFSDRKMIKNLDDFEPLFNQLGYTVSTIGAKGGSVKDYFREISYGKMDITISLYGIYEAPKTKAFYGQNQDAGECAALARFLAQEVVKEPGFIIKNYANASPNTVDGFHFIFAGFGQEKSQKPSDIWSHASVFGPAVVKDGVSISAYSCSPELNGLSGSSITRAGVICHEMMHAVCKMPDYYDTNYDIDGYYLGTGDWDLMASGCYNGESKSPSHPNMLIKVQCGWVTPTILNAAKTITNMPNAAEKPVAYRINTNKSDEFYLLENRQKVKFDTVIPGQGLIIYHVHPNQTACINCKHPQRMYPVCAGSNRITQVSSTTPIPAAYGKIDSQETPFPGSKNKFTFSHETLPAMKSWFNDYEDIIKPLTNITSINKLVSFEFMGGTGIEENERNTPVLNIIPNPASDYIDLQISMNVNKIFSIDFYNSVGLLVKTIPIDGFLADKMITQRISISDLSRGFYFVSVGNTTVKLVIQ
ncbi:MAG: M6 family metalloprotease domain-containing protein [Bacteroidales bacterium]|jgi:M6 family metalloprotease-like protein|nr:M6 family metalloprotease domain-containing protein [Bacteroidales bacterium]